MLFAAVYHPLKSNKDLQVFADFIAGIMLKYDCDFNVHICCKDKPMVKDFLNLIYSFNLTQWVSGSTHGKGHTLDLVLSHGLCVHINEICDTLFYLQVQSHALWSSLLHATLV